MIIVKNQEQIRLMRIAGRITAEAILLGAELVKPGVTTKQIDERIRHHIEKCGARPSFLGYGGFPGSACISINEQVIHGIPSRNTVLQEGDIVKIDVGAYIHGFHGDSARTIPCGRISAEAQKLIDVAKRSFELGAEAAGREGARIGDIGAAIDGYVTENGFSTVKKYVGHGVGHDLHEDPNVPNFGTAGRGPKLCRGMVIAIEPMINAGTDAVRELSDGWTVLTKDGRLSAHYENTVAITDNGVEILTRAD
jgi:methionyl aminopeptidase